MRNLLPWKYRRIYERLVCRIFGHDFYQAIGGYGADGIPSPCKACKNCDYTEEM